MRRVPPAPQVPLLERGVWKACWQGPRGEIVLLAVRSDHKLLAGQPHLIELGADHIAAADTLWDVLDRCDPVTGAATDAARRRAIRVV